MQDDAKKNKITVAIRTTSYLWAPARDVMQLSSLVRPPIGDVMQLSSLVPSSSLSWGWGRGHRGRELGRWGRGLGHWSRGRGRGLGHRDLGHHLKAEVSEVATLTPKSARSRPRVQGWGHGLGRWGWHCHLEAEASEVSEGQVGEVEGSVGIRDGD
jgi:hypothetical protein